MTTTQNKDEILSALDHHFAAYPWQAHSYAWVPERMSTAIFTLRRVAEASEGHVGHKNMIWIGRGFPNVNWIRFASVDQDRVHNAMQQTVNELRDARVTLYTIDPAGVMVDPGAVWVGSGSLRSVWGRAKLPEDCDGNRRAESLRAQRC